MSESKDNSVIEHLKKSYLEVALMGTDAAVTHFSSPGRRRGMFGIVHVAQWLCFDSLYYGLRMTSSDVDILRN